METSLAEFIADINRTRKSGLLSITMKGANTLLKLFFREGQVYHLTCGNVKGSGCLAQIVGSELAEYFFMPDVTLNVQESTLPSLPDIIEFFKSAGAAVRVAPHPGAGGGKPAGNETGDTTALQDKIQLALTRQIGPAGARVMKRIVAHQWRPSSPPGKDDHLALLELLKVEIENADDQNAFVDEARRLLS